MNFRPLSRALHAAVLGFVGVVTPFDSALAQPAYPAKPIRLIVPFPPGGGTDMIARTVAQKMAEQNKWSVVVDNRPGAGGNLGVDAAAKAAPDGYTLVMGQTSNLAINPWLYAKLPYDPIKSLAPVALVSSAPIVMAAPANTPYKTFADLV
uniref:Bug family tripartite tricarboxylate transporter substrate binding protein n=2 Tax=Comamonadaceae TaxID=80864 RepID=UPI00209BE8E3